MEKARKLKVIGISTIKNIKTHEKQIQFKSFY